MKKQFLTFLLFATSIVGCFYFALSKSPEAVVATQVVATKSLNEAIGRIITYRGEASVVRNGQQIILSLKDEVFEADSLQTKEKSFVKLKMKDGSIVSLGPNSKLNLQEYKVHSPTEKDIALNLVKGIVRTSFFGKNKKGKIDVITRSAVMGVRGTDFVTEISNGSLSVSLLEGKVEVSTPVGKKLTALKPGQKISFSDLKNPEVFTLNTLIESEAELNKRVEVESEKELHQVSFSDDAPGTEVTKLTMGVLNSNMVSGIIPSLNKTTLSKNEHSSTPQRPLSPAAKQMAQFQEQKKMLTSKEFEALPRDKKIELLETVKQVNEDRAEALESEEKALPLITPDNKVVFFEDKPELKALLPRDEKGEILGLKVDENFELEGSFPSGQDEGIDSSIIEVPVVNERGQIEMVSVQNSKSQVVEIPVTKEGSVAGVAQSVVEQASRDIASVVSEETESGGKANNGNHYGQEKKEEKDNSSNGNSSSSNSNNSGNANAPSDSSGKGGKK